MLKKKSTPKLEVPTPGEYDFSEMENDKKACGLDTTTLKERMDNVFSLQPDVEKENIVAVISSRFENNLSKREMAFILTQQSLMSMMAEEKARMAAQKEGQTVPGQDNQ